MGKKITGMLNLSKIPKELIFTTKKGDKAIFIDVVPNKNGTDQYGNTHAVTLYNKEKKETIYLGNLKEQEFGGNTQSSPAARDNGSEDLPF